LDIPDIGTKIATLLAAISDDEWIGRLAQFYQAAPRPVEIERMKRVTAQILLILLILALACMACVGGGGDANGVGNVTGSSLQATQSAGATATYGAQQFHLQLTAIADPSP